jgi:hypothetical protein
VTPKAQAYLFDTVVVTNHALFRPVLLWPLAAASFAGGRFQALVLIMAKSGREKTPGVKKTISKDAQREERLKKSESKAEKLKSEKKKLKRAGKRVTRRIVGRARRAPSMKRRDLVRRMSRREGRQKRRAPKTRKSRR